MKKKTNPFRRIISKLMQPIHRFADAIYPPGFEGASLYEISILFLEYVGKPRFNLYAGALSFNFFVALFPTLLFLFTLVAYIPIDNLQTIILGMMQKILPDATFQTIQTTIKDIVSKQRSGLLSFGFLSAIYFASNGFHTMTNAFDSSLEEDIKRERNFFKRRFLSIGMTFIVSILLILSIIVLVISGYISTHMEDDWGVSVSLLGWVRKVIEFSTLSALVYFIISFIYYLGPSNLRKWKFFSPGSIVATILSLLTTYLFTSYVNHFNLYNKVYGSIGAIVALMLLIYINVYAILIGFELNHSINKVSLQRMREEKKKNRFLI